MTVEQMNVIISAATLVVLLTAAVAALVQLRHIRASNDLSTFSEAFELWYSPAVQEGITFIHRELPTKMEDPAFRRGLETAGPVDRVQHPEVNVLDFFDNTAIYLVMPGGRCPMRHALIGVATVTLLWEMMRHILAWYYTTMSQIQLVYGSLTTAIAVLLSVEISALVLLVGAQVIDRFLHRSDEAFDHLRIGTRERRLGEPNTGRLLGN